MVERNRAYLREWLPWVDFTTSAEDLRRFIMRVREQFDSGRGPQCGLWIDGAFAGSVGCHPIDWPNRNCSIGYWIEERYQGKGIMTRCCASMLDYLFDDLGLHRVTIQCGVGNTRSCAIPERLGLRARGRDARRRVGQRSLAGSGELGNAGAGLAGAPHCRLSHFRVQANTRSSAAMVAASSFAPGGRISAHSITPRRRSTSLRMAMPSPSWNSKRMSGT